MRSVLAACLAFALAGSICVAGVEAGSQDPELHLQRGVELLEARRVAEAIEELETALLQRPRDVRIRYHLGRALLLSGRAEEAVEHLQIALDVATETGPIQFLLGQVYLETGDFAAARAALDAADASRPGFLQIDFYSAELCYRVGQVSIAREKFEALVEAVPEWEAALIRAGTLALEQGDATEAILWFQAVLEISPENPLVWLRLGTALVADDQAYEALAAYRRSAELAPNFPTALNAVAIQLINLDDHEEAMEALDAVLVNDPDDGVMRYHRANLLSREGQHADALVEIDAALEDLRAPRAASTQSVDDIHSLAKAVHLRADLLMKLERRDEAVEVLRELVASDPDYLEALFLLGNALARGGDRAAGMELLERFKTLSDAREHRQLGDQFRRLEKDPVRARSEFEDALEILPDDPGSLLGLGAVQRETGEIQQAIGTLEKARAAGVGGVEWHREWVLALHLAGRAEEARQAWEAARGQGLTLGPEVWAVMYDGDAAMQVSESRGAGRRGLAVALAAMGLLTAVLVGLLWRNPPSPAPDAAIELAESPAIETASLRAGPNLVLVTLDTLRADRLGSYGYEAAATPHLDRIAAEGVRFEQAVSPVPATLPAHVSILTGQDPYRHKVRDNGTFQLQDDALTLAEVLRGAGYETAGFIAAFVLDAQFGTAQGFDEYTDFDDQEAEEAPSPFPNIERRGGEVVEEAVEWLQGQEGPFFAWVHLYDPHDPYAPPEPYRSRYRQRPYDGEIAYTDEVVGRLLAGLEAAGHDRDTLLIVVADHGEGLGDHGESMHGFFVYDTTVRVPLILWADDDLPAGRVVTGQARLIDLLPTALALLEIPDPAPASRDGADLRELIAAPDAPGPPAYSEAFLPLLLFGWSELRALRADGFKYIAAPRPELYDLRSDPDETTNLLAFEPRLAATMRANLEELVAGDDDPVEFAAGRRPLDADTFERLRSLGYIGGGASVSDHRDIDPKDRVELFQDFANRVNVVFAAAADERWDEAAAELEVLERLAPNHFSVQHGLGMVALAQGNVEEAVRRLEQALSLNPSYSPSLIQLSKAYRAAGRHDRASALLREGMDSFPDVFSFPFELARSYHLEGRLDDALEIYQAAGELQPRNPMLLRSMAHLHLSRSEPREALRRLETLVEVAPDDPEAWGNLGMVLGGLGEFPRAETAFRRGLSLAPDIPTMHFNLGLVLLRQGDSQGAADAFRSALQLDPSFEPARQQLARIGRGGE